MTRCSCRIFPRRSCALSGSRSSSQGRICPTPAFLPLLCRFPRGFLRRELIFSHCRRCFCRFPRCRTRSSPNNKKKNVLLKRYFISCQELNYCDSLKMSLPTSKRLIDCFSIIWIHQATLYQSPKDESEKSRILISKSMSKP